ncbi:MAG: DUF4149 domain-containing protein [Bacteroidota bacterium]
MTISEVLKERKIQIISMLMVYMGISLWLGGLVFFGFGVASQIFKLSPSRDVAGLLNRAFLHRLNIIEFVSAAFLLIGISMYNFRFKSFFHRAPLFLAIVAVTLLCGYSFVITPSMNELLLKIPSFENVVDPVLKAQFDTYHTMYSMLVQINLLLLFVIFLWQTIIYTGADSFEKSLHSQ